MKKLLNLILTAPSLLAFGQNTAAFELKAGVVVETELVSYKTPFFIDAGRWMKLKPEKRDKEVLKFNTEIAEGKTQPQGKSIIKTEINQATQVNGRQQLTGTTQLGVTPYKLTLSVGEDTLDYKLNDGVPFPIVNKNDTIGIWCYGVRKFPLKPQVGTYFPGYINEMNLFPYDFKRSRRSYFMVDGGNGYSYSGFVIQRKNTRMNVTSIMLNTPFYVTTTEEIEIAGKKYTSYKLLNSYWTKSTNNAVEIEDPSVYFNDPELSKKIKQSLADVDQNKVDAILKKAQSKSGLVPNEQGYFENFQENWYVPELGLIVKSKSYDGYGALLMESKVVAIKQK